MGELDSSADRKVEDTQSDRNDDSKTKSKTDKARRVCFYLFCFKLPLLIES